MHSTRPYTVHLGLFLFHLFLYLSFFCLIRQVLSPDSTELPDTEKDLVTGRKQPVITVHNLCWCSRSGLAVVEVTAAVL